MKTPYGLILGRREKQLAIFLLVPSFLIFAPAFLFAFAVLMFGGKGLPVGPVTGCVGIFGFLGFTSGWMLIRLSRDSTSKNGITMMPVWLIQLFGWFFTGGLILPAITGQNF